jgi:hypothetical protein
MINATSLLGVWLAGLVGGTAPSGPLPPVTVPIAPPEMLLPPAASASAPVDVQGIPVRIWVEENTDLFYPNDPVNLRFRAGDDAYVAVVHLDPDGNLELLFPSSPWEDEFVRGQRIHTIAGPGGRFTLGRTPGIGYFYAIASPYPLDLRFFRTRTGGWSDGSGFGRVVRGDPFWTLEYLTQLLSPDWRYAPVGVDVFSYHTGGRHRYPAFACYDRFSRPGGGAYPYYPSCDRLQRLLAAYPNYYDTRRYRGDRGGYLRGMEDLAPRHELKEPVGRYAPPLRERDNLQRAVPRGQAAPPVGQQREGTRAEPTTPARQRPTLERRPNAEREPSAEPRRANPPARESAPPQREAPPPAREREQPRPEPRRVPDPAGGPGS